MAKKTESGKKTKRASSPAPQARISDYALLKHPIITEKSSREDAEKASQPGGFAVFKVDRRATKLEVKQAIERVFGVEVQSVNTCNIAGKPKRWMSSQGRRAAYKKAYVTLKAGHTLSVVEGI